MTTLTISAKGWVVIPAAMRAKYKIGPGDQVQLVDYGGVISLIPTLADPIKQSRGLLKGKKSLLKALVDEHDRERARDFGR